MPQLAAQKRKRPQIEKSDAKTDEKKGGLRRLWDEEGVEELEAAATNEREKEERKRARRAKKRKLAEAASEDLEQKAAAADVIIALDMSTSPGLAIVDRSNPKKPIYHLLGFAQTDKQQTKFDQLSNSSSKNIRTALKRVGLDEAEAVLWVVRSPKEGEYEHNTDFYERITEEIMRRILFVIKNEDGKRKSCLAVIEAYAFHIVHSSSITKLAEIGGVMRNKLWKENIPFVEVSPTSIKKWFAGKGTADKPEMWNKFQKIVPEIKLDEWLPAALTPQKIPSPHQDIVDAFAAAHSIHANHPTK